MNQVAFIPPARTLMGPGPSDVHPEILTAMARPTIGHLDPQFIQLMDDIKFKLQWAFQTKNALTLPISAPGSAGMEACFANLVSPGDQVLVCQNGVFGGRMAENGRALAVSWCCFNRVGRAIDPAQVDAMLKDHPKVKLVAFVHAETSTGVASDAKAICSVAAKAGCLTIVDCVTSLAGIEVALDDWGADAAYSGTQKCLSCAPGLAPFSMSDRAVEAIKARNHPVASWFLDMNLVMGYWGENTTRAYHHTAPVNALYGLHQSLSLLQQEGLEASWRRHAMHHQALKAGLEALGLNFVVPESERLPQLNLVSVPDGVDEALVRQRLLSEFNLEIGAGLGVFAGKVWRIGLMGYASRRENVLLCVSALESVLADIGAPVTQGAALPATMEAFA